MNVRHLEGSIQFRNGLKPKNSNWVSDLNIPEFKDFFLHEVFKPLYIINQIAEFSLGMDYKHP